MQSVNPRLVLSSIFLAAATLIAIARPVPVSVSWPLLVAGVILSMYSSFIRVYKSYFLVKFAAYESVQAAQTPSVVIQTPGTMLQISTAPAGQMIGKILGTGYLLASRLIEGLLLFTASGLALIYLLFVHFGSTNPVPFLGLWLLILGLISVVLSKIPIVRDFTVGDMAMFSALDLTRWLVDTLAVWAFVLGFGYSVNVVGLFLVMSIVLLLEKLPTSIMGLGQDQLIGEGILAVFKLPLFPAFLAFLLWDVLRVASGIVMSYIWRQLEFKNRMSRWV